MAIDQPRHPDELSDHAESHPQQALEARPSTPDGRRHAGYDPAVLDVILGEAAHLLRALGFAAKTAALTDRDKPKDAYDIVWVLENWPGGPTHAAAAIRSNPVSEHPHAVEALRRLFDAFTAVDRIGPSSYARFLAADGASRDERLRLGRQATGAVNELSAALRRQD